LIAAPGAELIASRLLLGRFDVIVGSIFAHGLRFSRPGALIAGWNREVAIDRAAQR